MHRRHFIGALVLVGLAGALGGLLVGSLVARPAYAQPPTIPMEPPPPNQLLDRQALKDVLHVAFPELAPEGPLTGAEGTIVNVCYDVDAGRFGAILNRHQKKNILLLTDDPGMIAALGMAFTNERLISVSVQPIELDEAKKNILDPYQVCYVLSW